MTDGTQPRAHWSNRLVFILAAAGSAIGLGNIWKFPYIAGENGGGAFVLVYLLCIGITGVPIFLAELMIGRDSQSNAVSAFDVVHRPKSPWRVIGFLGVLSAFLILSFYSVVGGWVLNFAGKSLINSFAGHTDQEIRTVLDTLFSSPWTQVMWHALFMFCTVAMVMGGLKNGLERWNKILMPSLLALLLFLLIRVIFLDGFSDALVYLFRPDWGQLTMPAVLEALGHAFFTLSLGMGAMITYGSYLSRSENLMKTTMAVATMDTVIAIISGIVIFTVVFTFGMEPGAGPALMFKTLPVLFVKMTGGYIVSLAFFVLVSFAAFTSAISLLEVVVAYVVENLQVNRRRGTIVVGLIAFSLGILSALSTNVLSDVKIGSLTFFDLFDSFTSKFSLPFGGLLISIFYGWILGPAAVEKTLGKPIQHVFSQGLLWTSRIVAPAAIALVLINGLYGAFGMGG